MTTPIPNKSGLEAAILSALNAGTKIPFGYFDSRAGQKKLAHYLAEKLAPREQKLVEALKAVEFTGKGEGFWAYCPWCKGLDGPTALNGKHGLSETAYGHRPDCQRQAALALAK